MTTRAERTEPAIRRPASLLNKVPEVTTAFWVVKVLCTTVGETFADFLNDGLGLGLTVTSVVMTALLVVALVLQFRTRRYVPWVYWLTVVLISVVGTLLTDTLTDSLGVSLWTSTIVFSVALAVLFGVWYSVERTLSVHDITTRRREGFYWATILVTFALGTAVGDLLGEQLALGYLPSVFVFAGVIALVALAHRFLGLGAVVAFWSAYVLTRPLGASLGDLLSQDRSDGGLGLGPTATSLVFLVAIAGVVGAMTVSARREVSTARHA
ncbi:hypothetical protein [Frigoribacterium sp. SL97]|jgi:uncharacterized membrane-anchored protein|uniref:COG4705 family protein n=1 Tax=Frigoribacterium sp. SL97 TaxID=2994664 RepID=UPI0022719879|nr:hypothetical protein [Frigoribacterium sp. SL97]WAC51420.1 hypothetical protein OVA02_16515 [Frigoribacterium sp. SL97]